MRTKLEKNNFYADVMFEDRLLSKNVKDLVENWMNNLQKYKNIKIVRFKDLISKLNEIVFPICIKKSHSTENLYIHFIDNEGKEYYMLKTTLYSFQDVDYVIGRRNCTLEPLVDREFHYRINSEGIELIKTFAMKLNEDGTNDDAIVEFCYVKKNIVEVKLKTNEQSVIAIEYPKKGYEFDKKVFDFLTDIYIAKWIYYDIFPLFKWFFINLSSRQMSISISAKIKDETLTEINVENGYVNKYTVTQIISEEEMHIIKKLFVKDVKTFFMENSNNP